MFFTVDELDLSTWGIVEAIDDCPPIADGEGEVVISRCKTLQAEEMTRITLAEGSEILGTSVHPVWSVDAEDWVPLAELVDGERLQTRSGEIKIASVETFVYRQSVYNFGVHTEHIYEIGELEVLVNNGGGAGCPIGKAPNRVTGSALTAARGPYRKAKPQAWMDEAAKNPGKYTADRLERMKNGLSPIGSDGFPMEIYHRTPLAEGGSNLFDNFQFMTRTDHRLGPNYKINHPNLP